MPSPQERIYTIKDIYSLPEGTRAELIDGQMYMMSPCSTTHQRILSFLHLEIGNYIRSNKGSCEVFPAPFAVRLFDDDEKYLEPDISIICDPNKLNDKGCSGTPDWIVEIVSPGSKQMDYYTKVSLYRSAGVREYWIVDSLRKTIIVYDMVNDDGPVFHSFNDKIKAHIYTNFEIDFSHLTL